MKTQTQFSDKRVNWYGCAVCSLIKEILDFFKMGDISDDEMTMIVKEGIKQGILNNKLWISDWEDLGNLILKILGNEEYEVVFIASIKPGKELYFKNDNKYLWNYINATILQYEQMPGSKEKYHFCTNKYNPDPSVKIRSLPCGMRMMGIVRR